MTETYDCGCQKRVGTAEGHTCPEAGLVHGFALEPFICDGDHHAPVESVKVTVEEVQGDPRRTLADVREWVAEREDHERRNAPARQNTPASGMTMGALETLDALTRYLNGDDSA